MLIREALGKANYGSEYRISENPDGGLGQPRRPPELHAQDGIGGAVIAENHFMLSFLFARKERHPSPPCEAPLRSPHGNRRVSSGIIPVRTCSGSASRDFRSTISEICGCVKCRAKNIQYRERLRTCPPPARDRPGYGVHSAESPRVQAPAGPDSRLERTDLRHQTGVPLASLRLPATSTTPQIPTTAASAQPRAVNPAEKPCRSIHRPKRGVSTPLPSMPAKK